LTAHSVTDKRRFGSN